VTPAPPWEDLGRCRAVTERHARTFSLAAHLLPREIRAACYAVYAFCRRADDAVDNAPEGHSAAAALGDARDRLRRAFSPSATADPDPELRALAWAAARFGIQRAPLDALLDGMALDLGPVRVLDRPELLRYCSLAAGTVGRALAPALGAPPAAAAAAEALGIAMQLTNILRDVAEDLDRGRVYLAHDELALARVSVEARKADAPFRHFFAGQIAQAREWYARAEPGLRQIPSLRARLCVRAMGVLYGEILSVLERRGCDPFAGRARVGTLRKLWLVAACLFGRPLPGVATR
jgi:phytoene synthase